MKKVLKYALMGLLCLIISYLFCQPLWASSRVVVSNDTLKPLEIGDQLPELILKEVLNHTSSSLDLSQYKGKLIILDFWASWCAPCLQMMPKSNDLQEKYKDQLQIIPVTYESKEKALQSIQRIEKAKSVDLDLPFVVNEKVLHALFPHQALPHYVWISPEGKFLGYTALDGMTEENILEAFETNSSSLISTTKPVLAPFEVSEPFSLSDAPELKGRLISQFSMYSHIPGLPSTINFQYLKSEGRIVAYNSALVNMYLFAYGRKIKDPIGHNRMIIESKDKVLLVNEGEAEPWDDWRADNTYNYERVIPLDKVDQANDIFIQDLDEIFDQYEVFVEPREIDVYALRIIDQTKAERLSDTLSSKSSAEVGVYGFRVSDKAMGYLTYYLGRFFGSAHPPVIDQTNYKENISLQLDADMNKLESVNSALANYGLSLVKDKATLTVLVIKDRPTQNSEKP